MNVIELGSESMSYIYKGNGVQKKISIKSSGVEEGKIVDYELALTALQYLRTLVAPLENRTTTILAHHCPIYLLRTIELRCTKKTHVTRDAIFKMSSNFMDALDENPRSKNYRFVACYPHVCILNHNSTPIQNASTLSLNHILQYKVFGNYNSDIKVIESCLLDAGFNLQFSVPISAHIGANFIAHSSFSIISMSCSSVNVISYRDGLMTFFATIGPGLQSLYNSVASTLNCSTEDAIKLIHINSDKIFQLRSKPNHQVRAITQRYIEFIFSTYVNKYVQQHSLASKVIIAGHGLSLPNIMYIASEFINDIEPHSFISASDIYTNSLYNTYCESELDKSSFNGKLDHLFLM